jgi:hypothetical protein
MIISHLYSLHLKILLYKYIPKPKCEPIELYLLFIFLLCYPILLV